MKAISTVFRLISRDLLARFIGVVALATVVALLEMMGVASIMPFVAMLTDPEAFQRSLAASPLGHFLPAGMMLPPVHVLGFVVIALFAATNVISLLSVWVSIRFAAVLGVRMSRDLAESYFRKGYLFLQSQGAGVLANDITRETEKLAACSVLQLCLLISKLVQVLFIVALLAAISPEFILVFSFGALILYSGLYALMRGRVSKAGQDSVSAVAESSRRAYELFAAAKDILVGGHARYFIQSVANASSRFFKSDAVARLAPVVPKYLIELVAFSALLSVPIYRSLVGQEYQSVVPVITLFAYAGYRMLPAIQQLYGSYSLLKFYDPLAERVANAIHTKDSFSSGSGEKRFSDIGKCLSFDSVACAYPGQDKNALQQLSLTIERGDKLAVIGPSGAGKSTLLDVLLGLLPIGAGNVFIGDGAVTSGPIPWVPGAIGYVPQAPLMISASIAENIAFGIPSDQIDLARCDEVAQIACVSDVVERLPDGFCTVVGEGVALSGGESQRIAIARALYGRASLVVMDEPSSALDPMVSSRLVKNLCMLGEEVSLVVVTHDWELLASFSKIAVIDAGKVVAVGRPDEMVETISALRTRLSSDLSQNRIEE